MEEASYTYVSLVNLNSVGGYTFLVSFIAKSVQIYARMDLKHCQKPSWTRESESAEVLHVQ